MNVTKKIVFVVVTGTVLATSSDAGPITLFFDFGSGAHTTPGNYNNIITTDPQTLNITNAIDSTGAVTAIDLTIKDFGNRRTATNNGANPNGTTMPMGDAAIFQPEATRDSSYSYAGLPGPPQVTIQDLAPNMTYELTFFASVMTDTVISFETRFGVTGQGTTDVVFLEPANNVSNVAIVSNISPYLTSIDSTSTWTIAVFLSPGPNNNNSGGFYYLGALRLVCIPEPMSSMLVLFGASLLILTRTRYAARKRS